MSLPAVIEIIPLAAPIQAEITVPGSKSITNRALILAALSEGKTVLQGALWSEDTQVMVDCLHKLGFEIEVATDPKEFCNRIITVQGQGGKIPKAGTTEQPLELFVGNAGTAARFLSALVCLGQGVYRLSGVARMHERPQAALFKALRELGYKVDSENDKLPAVIFGGGACGDESVVKVEGKSQGSVTSVFTKHGLRSCTVSIEESSQFASALLLCAVVGGWTIKVVGENAEESPYVAMTSKLIEAFPKKGGTFQIEPDASSGSYFIGAGWLLGKYDLVEGLEHGSWPSEIKFSKVNVPLWPKDRWQIDAAFIDLPTVRSDNISADGKKLQSPRFPTKISRLRDLGDSIMTQIALTPLLQFGSATETPVIFTDLGRLRVQECERVHALRTELTRCGGKVSEEGDTLTVYPAKLHGAEVETYDDHRMAMCFAILGLKVPGIKIKNPACVKKTFPNFFQKLAAAVPGGLGATILDADTRRSLTEAELFAD